MRLFLKEKVARPSRRPAVSNGELGWKCLILALRTRWQDEEPRPERWALPSFIPPDGAVDDVRAALAAWWNTGGATSQAPWMPDVWVLYSNGRILLCLSAAQRLDNRDEGTSETSTTEATVNAPLFASVHVFNARSGTVRVSDEPKHLSGRFSPTEVGMEGGVNKQTKMRSEVGLPSLLSTFA